MKYHHWITWKDPRTSLNPNRLFLCWSGVDCSGPKRMHRQDWPGEHRGQSQPQVSLLSYCILLFLPSSSLSNGMTCAFKTHHSHGDSAITAKPCLSAGVVCNCGEGFDWGWEVVCCNKRYKMDPPVIYLQHINGLNLLLPICDFIN